MSSHHDHGHSRADETHANCASDNQPAALPALTRPRPDTGGDFTLIRDDNTWAFNDADNTLVTRRLRVWLDGNGGLIAVVTEAGTGTGITDAAHQIHHQLTTAEYPERRVRIFEHWPADTADGSDEYFDEVLVDGSGEVTWLDTPAGPFTSILRLPTPQESQNQRGRVARHRVFRCFDEGSMMITDPHGWPFGVLEIGASPGTDKADGSHRLAAALLASATDDDPADLDLVALFAQTVLAELPATGWRLGDAQITGWLDAQKRHRLVP